MQENISYQKAIEVLQLNKQNITIPHTLINFRSMTVSDIPESHSHSELIESKNIIIRNWIEEQLQLQGHWDIKSPYKDACKKCNGTGELYKLEKEKRSCESCNGKGYLWLICKNCKGTGRHRDEDIKDLIINVKCNCAKFAKHYGDEYKGKIRVRCRECRGQGNQSNLKKSESWQNKDFKYTGKIYSTTKCPDCNGYGFPITPKGFMNPVLSNKLSQIINTESAEHEDPFVPNPPYIVHKIPVRTVYSTIDPSMMKLARESI